MNDLFLKKKNNRKGGAPIFISVHSTITRYEH